MNKQSRLPELKKLPLDMVMESRNHNSILDEFVKQDAKLIDVLVKK